MNKKAIQQCKIKFVHYLGYNANIWIAKLTYMPPVFLKRVKTLFKSTTSSAILVVHENLDVANMWLITYCD